MSFEPRGPHTEQREERHDYLIISSRKKDGKNQATEAILLSRTEQEAEREAWKFKQANKGMKFRAERRAG